MQASGCQKICLI